MPSLQQYAGVSVNGFTTVEFEAGTVDLELRTIEGRPDVRLTPMEARLLGYLAERPEQVVGKDQLLEHVWGLPPGSESRTVFATIERLRRKVERDPKCPRHLLTIGRSGYSFRPLEPTEPEPEPPPRAPAGRSFVGRERELKLLGAWLAEPGVVTVHGPGGVGKTRLVDEAVRGLGSRPVWRCALESATSPAEVVERVARAVDVVVDPDLARAAGRIGRVSRDGVLFLDGVEGCADAVASLVAGFGAVRPRVVLTSRAPVGIPGERLLAVGPLSLDGARSEAVELFLAAAGRRRPGWSPDAGQLRAVVALVTALDGLPLAIEVAASWLALLEPSEILTRLHQVVRSTLGVERAGTVEQAIAWSWDALSPADRAALGACSVFEERFTADAAEGVIGGDDAMNALGRLVERSLVHAVDAGGRRTFQLLNLVRGFVGTRVAPESLAGARIRHAGWVAAAAERTAFERSATRETYAAVGALQRDLEQVVRSGTGDQAAVCALALAAPYKDLGPVSSWLRVVSEALARDGVAAALRVRLLLSQATALRYCGRSAEVLPVIEVARRLSEAEAPELAGWVELSCGTYHFHCGDVGRGREHFDALLSLSRASGDSFGEGVALAELATVAWRAHRLDEAASNLRDALRLLRQVGARHAEAVYQGNLAVVELTRGRFELARESLLAVLALHRQLGSVRFECATLTNLGVVELRRGDPKTSRPYFEQAVALAQRTGDQRDEVTAVLNLCSVALAEGHPAEARRWLDHADPAVRGLGLELQTADAELAWAAVHRLEREPAAALAALARAEEIGRRAEIPTVWLRVAAERGLVALSTGDRAAAAGYLAEVERRLPENPSAEHEILQLPELRGALTASR